MASHKLQAVMKRDGGTHDRQTREAIRMMAVERILEGEDVAAVMSSYGFCRTTAYKWLDKAQGRGRGLRCLAARKGTGRPRKLAAAQGAPGISLDQRQESDAVRIRLWAVDATDRARTGGNEIWHQPESRLGGRVAGAPEAIKLGTGKFSYYCPR